MVGGNILHPIGSRLKENGIRMSLMEIMQMILIKRLRMIKWELQGDEMKKIKI